MRRRYLAILVPFVVAAANQPPPPWAETRGDLDGDKAQETARLDRDGTLLVTNSDGKERAKIKLEEAGRIERAQLTFVPVEDRVVLHARAELGHGQAAEVVLARDGKVLFNGRTGPVGDGDRGERLRVDEWGVVRYQTAPGATRCDGNELLFPERWDFAGNRFRPVVVEVPAGRMLRASTTPPPGLTAPPLGLFRFVAASIDASGERRADLLGSPRELDDGAPATVWHAGEGGAATGAWATARAEAGTARIAALKIVTGPHAPESLAIVLGPAADQSFRVALAPGTQWITLPPATPATACVSIVVERAGRGDNSLAEVAIFSDVEGPEGLQRLVTTVAELRPDADGAARLLIARGAAASQLVAAALPTSEGQGRHRLIQVLAAIHSPDSVAALGKALETAQSEDRAPLVAALAALGEPGLTEARRLLTDESQSSEARADAAAVMGEIAVADWHLTQAAIDALMEAAGKGDAPVRKAVMRALTKTTAEMKGAAARVAAGFAPLLGRHDRERIADVARALALGAARLPADDRAAVVAVIDLAWQHSDSSSTKPVIGGDDFALRLRLVRAMGSLGDARLLPSLNSASKDRNEVLRAEAVSAAAALPDGLAAARAHVDDADPGVRHAAAAALAAHPEPTAQPLLTHALASDGWPFVRHAAADGLGAGCALKLWPAPSLLMRAVNGEGKAMAGADASEEVRRAALAALGRCADAPFAALAAALAERRQPPSVRELAAALIAKRGGPEAAPALAHALDDVLTDPAADERFVALAVAVTRALGRAGDSSRPTLEALGAAANEPLSAAVRAAAMDSIGRLCPDGAGAALKKGLNDGDGSVARAAQSALARCRR